MITDSALYALAIFLGSIAMLLIVFYHFLEINAVDDGSIDEKTGLSKTPLTSARKTDAIPASKIAKEKMAGI